MFRRVRLSIIRSLFTVHSVMLYVIQVRRQLSSRTVSSSKAIYICTNRPASSKSLYRLCYLRTRIYIYIYIYIYVGLDSLVCIETCYGPDGLGIESRWGRDFPQPSRPILGAHTASLSNGYQFSFPRVKRPGRGVDHPTKSSAEVTERVDLYLNPPSGPSWLGLGWNLTLSLASYRKIHNIETDRRWLV